MFIHIADRIHYRWFYVLIFGQQPLPFINVCIVYIYVYIMQLRRTNKSLDCYLNPLEKLNGIFFYQPDRVVKRVNGRPLLNVTSALYLKKIGLIKCLKNRVH
jgi:hypothetical protein